MKRRFYSKLTGVICIGLGLMACNKSVQNGSASAAQQKISTDALVSENGANPDETGLTAISSSTTTQTSKTSSLTVSSAIPEKCQDGFSHYVYTESNGTGGNQILEYKIDWDGSLKFVSATASGGTGTGKGLGSQGALALGDEHALLLAVNAGNNTLSSFKIQDDGSIWLAHTAWSGGKTPISVTVKGSLLYVLNAGSDSIQGFRVRDDGSFSAIEGARQALSGAGVGGAQISFSPNGDWVLVTEKATNKISAFRVKRDGTLGSDVVTPSTGQTPYGFAFARDEYMIVSDAAGGAAGAGTTTSYTLGSNGWAREINGAVPNDQAAPCWVATTKYGRFAFVTNTASNSISSYYIGQNGDLTLVHPAAGSTDKGPIDIVVAGNNYNVYELNAGSNTIGEFYRSTLGGLVSMGSVTGLPAGAAGLVTL